MGVVADIGHTWRHGPRDVVARHVAQGPDESRTFALLFLGCVLVWMGQWPRLMREVELGLPDAGPSFQQLVGTALVTWLMVMPLAFFGLAALTSLASRLLGGGATPWRSRVALFWSWLAASPLALLAGLAAGFTGNSGLANVVAILWIAVFAVFWTLAQREASSSPARA